MKVISFANQKGGVAKTTTAVNVGRGLADVGKRVLLIDMDPQESATFAILGNMLPDTNVYQLLSDEIDLDAAITSTKQKGLDIIGSDLDLAGAEIELIQETGGQTMLRSKVGRPDYDYVLIDAPPSLGLLTINCLSASDEVIVPVSASVFALRGMAKLETSVEKVRSRLDRPHLSISGVVCTMTDNTNVSADAVDAVRDRFGDVVFETTIPRNVKIEEAHSRSESIYTYAPKSTGAQAYKHLVQEIINRYG